MTLLSNGVDFLALLVASVLLVVVLSLVVLPVVQSMVLVSEDFGVIELGQVRFYPLGREDVLRNSENLLVFVDFLIHSEGLARCVLHDLRNDCMVQREDSFAFDSSYQLFSLEKSSTIV